MIHEEIHTGLAKRLLNEGFLDSPTLNRATIEAKLQKLQLFDYLVSEHLLDCAKFAKTTARNFGYPLFDLSALDHAFIPEDGVNQELITKYSILPLAQTASRLYIAMADPSNQSVLDEIQFCVGKQLHPIIVNARVLLKVITNLQNTSAENSLTNFSDTDLDSVEFSDEDFECSNTLAIETNDAPIIKLVHKILLEAVKKGASDIHFEPYEKHFRIRMRLDGILFEVSVPPINLAKRICARIKVMSRLDISERRIPQDGRFKLSLLEQRCMDFRVSTCPTIAGEKIVIRLLDPAAAKIGIDALGFETHQRELFLNSINQPQGMILVTGPTGSGKTVTLYTALSLLNTAESNISSVEDPVEIHLDGINQVNINLKAGLNFSSALRAFLRQDPDVIMVGEMRDLETAEIAIKAAQTGHLVLSTLHTNSAPETLTRLANMGLPTYNIATSVSMIIAQRLIRNLCHQCKIKDDMALSVIKSELPKLTIDSNILIYKNNSDGCEFCQNGYKGRSGIFEVLPITDKMSSAILAGANSMELLTLAKEAGMVCLRESGLLNVIKGKTSLDEINRVTKD